MKTFKKLSLLVLAVFAFNACSNDDDATSFIPDPGPTLNIVETAQGNTNLSLLVEAVVKAGLVDALSATGNKTVLAPTNTAFEALLDSNPAWNSIQDIDNSILTPILLNHVIPAENIPSSDIIGNAGYKTTLATGPNDANLSIYFNDATFNGTTNVVSGLIDIATTNGVVHVVDEVIALPTLLTFATADSNFSVLEAAVTDANQGAVATALTDATTAAPLTVFAPIDTAFVALLDSNPAWNGLGDIDSALLTAVLTHHVIAGNVASGDLTPNGDTTAPTVQGQNITVTLPGTGTNIADMTDGSGNTDIGIIAVDVQASNGVIHAINKVLLPM